MDALHGRRREPLPEQLAVQAAHAGGVEGGERQAVEQGHEVLAHVHAVAGEGGRPHAGRGLGEPVLEPLGERQLGGQAAAAAPQAHPGLGERRLGGLPGRVAALRAPAALAAQRVGPGDPPRPGAAAPGDAAAPPAGIRLRRHGSSRCPSMAAAPEAVQVRTRSKGGAKA